MDFGSRREQQASEFPHGRSEAGDTGAKVLATYIVEKGKPLATPAP